MAAPALNSDNRNCDSRRDSVRGISWKFEIRQTHALIGNLVGANAGGRLKSECSAIRDVIVFIHSVAATTEPADKRAVAIQTRAAREENDSALVRICRAGLRPLCARIGDVHRIKTEERPGARTVDRKRHTSELQSRLHLVCRLLLEKKKNDA